MLLALSVWNCTHTRINTNVGRRPSVWPVSPRPVCVCVFARMFAGFYLPAYSHCATGVNMLTLTNRHSLHKASPHRRSVTGLQIAQTNLTAGYRRGVVVWLWPDKAEALRPPFPISLSLVQVHPSVHPSPTFDPHRLLSTNTCSLFLHLCLKSPDLADVCVCLYVFVSTPNTSLLILSPQHWPMPGTLHVCMCVGMCTCACV